MAKPRTLHELRILIPGQFRVRQTFSQHNRIHEYFWRCGCAATGVIEDELDVRHCDLHFMTLGLQNSA